MSDNKFSPIAVALEKDKNYRAEINKGSKYEIFDFVKKIKFIMHF